MCLVACRVPLHFLSFLQGGGEEGSSGLSSWKCSWSLGICGVVGPLSDSGLASQLTVLQGSHQNIFVSLSL